MTEIEFDDCLTFRAAWPADRPRPLQQTTGYGAGMRALGSDVQRLIVTDGEGPVLEALAVKARLLGFASLTTVFRGPLWLTDHQNRHINALTALKAAYPKYRWQLLALMPEGEADAHAGLMKQAGLKRVMSGFSTIWMDLTLPTDRLRANLHGKWRNQLKKAEQSDLQLHVSHKPKHAEWLLDKEAEQRGERRYQALPLGLVPYFRSTEGEESVLAVTAHLSGQKVAGALMLIHGTSATYHIGWVGDAGRAAAAHNLVLWQSLLALKDVGVQHLDMGGLNTTQLKGLARFKLGLGGTPTQLAGSFL